MQSKPSQTQAIDELSSLKNEISLLRRKKGVRDRAFKMWKRNVEVALSDIFGTDSQRLKEFQEIEYILSAYAVGTPYTVGTSESEWHDAYLEGLESADAILQSMIGEISEY